MGVSVGKGVDVKVVAGEAMTVLVDVGKAAELCPSHEEDINTNRHETRGKVQFLAIIATPVREGPQAASITPKITFTFDSDEKNRDSYFSRLSKYF